MTAKLKKNLDTFYQKLRVLKAFSAAESLLAWDRETHMPKGASPDRGQAMGVLAGFVHEIGTEKKFVKLVNELFEQKDELPETDRRSIQLFKKELDKSVKLPKEFVEETSEVLNASHAAWIDAKQKNDFVSFAPHLQKVIDNRKKYAEYVAPGKDPYDVNLDDYEEGLTQEKVTPLFATLRDGLKELLPKILEKQNGQHAQNPLNGASLDHHKLMEFLNMMVTKIGFDMDRGAFGVVEHPFEISISPNDIRLNTHLDEKNNSFTVMGMVHELGHGLYEQNVDPTLVAYGLDHGVSLGIHESQSRLLENMIGRSTAFWNFFFPRLVEHFPQLKSANVAELVMDLNKVTPSLIRTEADEVTYNLHIILRYELEQAIMKGDVSVKDLPELWRAKMSELIGVTPQTDTEGVLQDVHWSWGNFGYFPTYTLGNLNAAQLWEKFRAAHQGWEKEVESGNFASYMSWFKEHVWKHGSMLTPDEVMKKATGESTDPKYLLSYLGKKYLL